MSAVVGARRNVMVPIAGTLILVIGAAHALLGGQLTYSGAAALRDLQSDPAGGFGPLLQIVAGFVAAVGFALLAQGALGMAAGLGVLRRRQWGRVMGIVLAVLAVLWGLLFVSALEGGIGMTLGAVHVLVGAFVLVVLIREGREFSRLRD